MSFEKHKNIMTSLKDSVNTSLQVGLYKTKEKASLAHTQKAKAKRFSLRFFLRHDVLKILDLSV